MLNRVASPSFPDSISEVIYQSGQFTPAYSGALDKRSGRRSQKRLLRSRPGRPEWRKPRRQLPVLQQRLRPGHPDRISAFLLIESSLYNKSEPKAKLELSGGNTPRQAAEGRNMQACSSLRYFPGKLSIRLLNGCDFFYSIFSSNPLPHSIAPLPTRQDTPPEPC